MSVITAQQARRFAAAFAGNVEHYGRMSLNADGSKNVRTLNEPLPADAYARHLSGDGPFLGVVPIRSDNTCYFGAIDLDDDAADHHALERKVVELRLPLVVCRSKSGGAHLYCFGREQLPAARLVAALKRMRKLLGAEKNPNGKGVEIFPKQVHIDGKGSGGNWINLPYYDHAQTNRYAVRDGRQLTLDEFLDHAVARSITTDDLDAIGNPGTGTFADGPPCLESLDVDGFPAGTRNNGLFAAGLFFRLKNPTGWQEQLVKYNARIADPLPGGEVQELYKHIGDRQYTYSCGQEPLASLCQKKVCLKRQYGIGAAMSAKRMQSLPPLAGLVKIMTDPPRYRIKVGETEITLASEEVQQFPAFKSALFEKLNIVVATIKPHEWDDILRDLTDDMIEEPAPLEAGDRGLLVMFLNDFLLLRAKADGPEDVLRGLPWENASAGRVYFRAADLGGFLARRQFRRFNINEIYTILASDADLTFCDMTIKGASVRLWSVPAPADEQTEAFDVKTSKMMAV